MILSNQISTKSKQWIGSPALVLVLVSIVIFKTNVPAIPSILDLIAKQNKRSQIIIGSYIGSISLDCLWIKNCLDFFEKCLWVVGKPAFVIIFSVHLPEGLLYFIYLFRIKHKSYFDRRSNRQCGW